MARDKRGYLYRSRRMGSRVVRDYFGRGPWADAAEYLLAQLSATRTESVQQDRALDAAETAYRLLHETLERVAAAHLLAAGYYRHDRSPWRRRRGGD